MRLVAAISAIVAFSLASTAHAAFASVVNQCDTSVWITSTDSKTGPTTQIASTGIWSEALHFDPKTGIAITITTTKDGLWTAASTITYSYTINQASNLVYYDLDMKYGLNAAWTKGQLLVTTPYANCSSISWLHGVPPLDDRTQACQITDILLTLCAPE
ncbi:hypothetical protein BCR34DRAFT_600151 [Clohesyomyces aquaticus]|uniref:BYS1 domain protein n=1 Tax=Clohesyomyces aquaticus TaxID=1231657 RepID=A0A1Y1ZRY9_9PLEO|nr:hypothetical protein BCR34DRAFT_600151 [Clohesyomyces aquaticus]